MVVITVTTAPAMTPSRMGRALVVEPIQRPVPRLVMSAIRARTSTPSFPLSHGWSPRRNLPTVSILKRAVRLGERMIARAEVGCRQHDLQSELDQQADADVEDDPLKGDVLEDRGSRSLHLLPRLGRRDGLRLSGLLLFERFIHDGIEDGDEGEDAGGVGLEVKRPAERHESTAPPIAARKLRKSVFITLHYTITTGVSG